MDAEKLLLGTGGVVSSELTSQIEVPTSFEVSEIIKVIVQIVIGIATLIGIFKKTKKVD